MVLIYIVLQVSAFLTENTDHCLMKCSVKAEAHYCLWEPVASSRGQYHPPRLNWHLVLGAGLL